MERCARISRSFPTFPVPARQGRPGPHSRSPTANPACRPPETRHGRTSDPVRLLSAVWDTARPAGSDVSLPRSGFVGFRFPPEVITLAVRWDPALGLSYRDVEELLAERGAPEPPGSPESSICQRNARPRDPLRRAGEQRVAGLSCPGRSGEQLGLLASNCSLVAMPAYRSSTSLRSWSKGSGAGAGAVVGVAAGPAQFRAAVLTAVANFQVDTAAGTAICH